MHRYRYIADHWSNFRCRQGPLFNAVVGGEPLNSENAKFDLRKLKTSLCRTMWSAFRYLKPFRRDSRVWQTDGRTDFRIANAALTLRDQKLAGSDTMVTR